MKWIIRLSLTILLLLAVYSAHADRGGFYYEKIRFEAFVHKNNVWDVKETFVLNYLEPRHGFYRFIPEEFHICRDVPENSAESSREDFKYISDIDDLKITGTSVYDTKYDYGNYIIKIGDPYEEVTGLHTYEITYTYTYPDDRLVNKDYVFHTILGDNFNEDINHFEFRIEFEKPLPRKSVDSLRWYSGYYGSTSSIIPIEYKASTTQIYGSCDSVKPRHAITLYTDLPEGYYEGVEKPDHTLHHVWLGLTFLCLLFIYIRALTINRGRGVVKTIDFYPPDGISSAEVGVIIDTSLDTVDIASLIPWFAEKGYLTIKETGNDIVLAKVKDLPDNAPTYQKQFMDILFAKGKTVEMKKMERKEKEMDEMKASLEGVFSEQGRQKLVRTDMGFYVYVLLLIFSTLTMSTNIVRMFTLDEFFAMCVIWLLPAAAGLYLRKYESVVDIFSSVSKRVVVFVFKMAVMAGVAFTYISTYKEYGTPMSDEMVMVFFVLNFIACELCGRFMIDTDYRIDMIGRLLGFREFIETAEKPYLEKLQMEDAKYFYRILPYAMVFRMADAWSEKFKGINVEKPDWYSTKSGYDGYRFTQHLVGNVNDTIKSHITSISHSPSSGGSGGGGFSGGGGGGGGGGSW